MPEQPNEAEVALTTGPGEQGTDPVTGRQVTPNVVGTYSLVDYELGIYGGGPLFADGSLGGRISANFVLPMVSEKRGEVIFGLEPTSWTYDESIDEFGGVPGVQVNYEVVEIRGESPIPPGEFSDFAPITGTPLAIDLGEPSGPGHPDLLIRVTMNPGFDPADYHPSVIAM